MNLPDTITPLHGIAIAVLTIVGGGTILGATGRVTVFRDVTDLFTTFSMVAGWLACSYVSLLVLTDERSGALPALYVWIVGAALIAVLTTIWIRAWRDNGRVWSTLIAVLTKLPYAIFVPMLALSAVAPTGNTAAQRASTRASALLLLTIIAPILVALTRDKSAFSRILRGPA